LNKNSWIAIWHWPCHAAAATYSFGECGILSSPCQRNTSAMPGAFQFGGFLLQIQINSNGMDGHRTNLLLLGDEQRVWLNSSLKEKYKKRISSLFNRHSQTKQLLS